MSASVSRVIGLGAGGHAKVVIDILRRMGGVEVVGLLDASRTLWGTRVLEVPVLGDDSRLAELHAQGVRHAFVGVGAIEDLRLRRRLYETLLGHGFHVISARHPGAVVAPSAKVGEGLTLMALAVINPDARVGQDVIINTGAIVEHDCVIGDHAHVAPGAVLCGGVRVGPAALIGAGAVVRQRLTIGEEAIVGAGAVVVEDVKARTVVAGVPASVLRKIEAVQTRMRRTPAMIGRTP